MTDTASATLCSQLPPLPATREGGYEWIDELQGEWYAIPNWGVWGWDLGSWPLVVVAHYNSRKLFGLAVYCEGDVEVQAFPTRKMRDEATDRQAVQWWREFVNGPPDLAANDAEIIPDHRGAYARRRITPETAI